MRYLLDTNICIAIIKQQPPVTLRHLQKCLVGDVAVSTITVAELRYGAAKSQATVRNQQALDQFLVSLVVAEFGINEAQAYGLLRADLEKRGMLIGPLDMLIAAHAITLGATLVTNNTREFKRVKGLSIEDWTK